MTTYNKNTKDYLIKIIRGKIDVVVPAGSFTTQDINHGLSYIPAFKAYARINSDQYRFFLPAILSTGSGNTWNNRLHLTDISCVIFNDRLQLQFNSFDIVDNTFHVDYFLYADKSGLL